MTYFRKFRVILLVGALSISATAWLPIASASDVTWSTFDLGKARAILVEFKISDLEVAEAVYEWEDLIVQAQRARTSDEIVARLREQQKQWRLLAEQMKKDLEDVQRQAKKDAKIRAVANFLQMGAMLAGAVHEWKEKVSDEKEEAGREGQIRLREEKYLEKYQDGKWRVLKSRKLLIEGRAPSGLDEPSVAARRRQLETLSKLAPTLLCNVQRKSCFAPNVEPSTVVSIEEGRAGSKGGGKITEVEPHEIDPNSERIIELAKKLDLELEELAPRFTVIRN